jgi:hypothetical protein
MRPDPAIRFWDGEQLLLHDGLTLVRCGGHFDGGTVLHWPAGADGRGALLTGDIIQVAMDNRFVSFQYSYPNMVPVGARAVRHIVDAVTPFAFERLYGAFWDREIVEDGRGAIERSADRYLRAIAE